jgi:predicted metal-dependent phosphoesterase TrpH
VSLFRFDTHVHTSNTSFCAKVSGAELVHLYKNTGYDGIVITDHFAKEYSVLPAKPTWTERIEYFLCGYREAYEEGLKTDFTVILGMEIRFTESANDYLIYGFDETFLYQNKDLHDMGLAGFKAFVKDRNILIYQAHPFRVNMKKVSPALLDGLEVFNGNPRHDARNDLAYEYAKDHGLKMLSGSDFHQPQDLGLGGIVLPKRAETPQEFVDLLKKDQIVELIGIDSM